MENNLRFNSSICTSRSQSDRLLTLRLKRETADCYLEYMGRDNYGNNVWHPSAIVNNYRMPDYSRDLPAWSLDRLIEMMPQWIHTIDGSFKLTIDQGKLVCYREISDEVQTFVFGHTSLYDSIIDTIEKLIKEGYFNKEYLEE